MKQPFRLIVFLVFVFTFFASAGSLVFYTLGYRFNTDRGIFIYTGSLTIKSNPSVVTISIDGKPNDPNANRLNNTYHINGLQPGEHFIEISADGYKTWSKRITITSGLSTEFWNVLLTRNSYSLTTYSPNNINKIFPSPKSNLFAYVTNSEQGFSVSTFDTDTNEAISVFTATDYTFNPNDQENIEWSVDSQYISIPAEQDEQRNYFIVNTETKEITDIKAITSLANIRSVRWDSSRNNVLFAIADNMLYEIPLIDPTFKRILTENTQNYDISGNDIYFIQTPNMLVYKTSITNPETRTQITATPIEQVDSDSRYSIIAYDENRIALINYTNGQLFIYNKNKTDSVFTNLSSNASGAQFSDDGKKLLYWTDMEIFIYFTRDWETQPIRNADANISIGRFSQVIKNIHWSEDYEHVTFSAGPTIKIIELDNRSEKSLLDIINLPTEPGQILSNFADNMLLYTLKPNNDSTSQSLYSFDFPENISGFLPFNK